MFFVLNGNGSCVFWRRFDLTIAGYHYIINADISLRRYGCGMILFHSRRGSSFLCSCRVLMLHHCRGQRLLLLVHVADVSLAPARVFDVAFAVADISSVLRSSFDVATAGRNLS